MMRAWLAARRRKPLPLSSSFVLAETRRSASASLAEPASAPPPPSPATPAEGQPKQQQQQQQQQPPRRRAAPPPSAVASIARALAPSASGVPPHVRLILKRLRSEGHEAWLAGGAVRDILLGAEPRDFDVLTSAALEEVVVAFGPGSGDGDKTNDSNDGSDAGPPPPPSSPSWARVIGARHPVALVRAWTGAPAVEVSSLRPVAASAAVAAAAAAAARQRQRRESDEDEAEEEEEGAPGSQQASPRRRTTRSPPPAAPPSPPPSHHLLLTRPGVVAAAARAAAERPAVVGAAAFAASSPLPSAVAPLPPPTRLAADWPPRPWALGELALARRRSALSRDFTVNALLLDVFTGTLLDYTGRGVDDLLGGGGAGGGGGDDEAGGGRQPQQQQSQQQPLRGVLRCIADPPSAAFDEDAARVLRGVRCASRARLRLDPATERAMIRAAPLVPLRVGARRLAYELSHMLSHGSGADAVRLLWRVGLLGALLPLHASHAERRRRLVAGAEQLEEGEPASSSSSSSLDAAGGDAMLLALAALDRRCRPQSPAPPEAVLAVLAAPLLAEALEEASGEVVRALQLSHLRPQAAVLAAGGGRRPSAAAAPQTPAAQELLWARRPLRGVVMGAALDVVGALCRVGLGGGGGGGESERAAALLNLNPAASPPLLSRAHAQEAARILHAHFLRCGGGLEGEEEEEPATAAEALVHASLCEAGLRLDELSAAASALRRGLGGGGGDGATAARTAAAAAAASF